MKARRPLHRLVFGAVALLVVWLVACTVVFAFPRVDVPATTDATFFLSSDGGHAALQDRPDLRIGQVVVSRPRSIADWPMYRACDDPRLTCITPSPETTQGEAEAFARLAQERGWTSVTVVSQTSHVPRIRILMGRCFPGTVRVVAIPEHGLWVWLRAFAYETGAMLKVAVTPGCHDRLPWER
ncbi:hypothetical protein GA0111570_102201 [Raineyella antarctica]|uniref:DUF218 domain-containing protein n=1 Tax=Raineyella antarctica TaxID=1577474 RepID=A0A1G6GEI4_9ACTN|nr:hypothetical protein [Raineyella antarctica]SDB80411.1 hypothetical protein GA0111570_102201 [Raineyella antarctica]